MSKLFACICIFLSFSVQASEIAGWDMQLVSCQNYDKFVFAGDVETYTGEIEFQTMEQTPSQDNIFVLCELKAEKIITFQILKDKVNSQKSISFYIEYFQNQMNTLDALKDANTKLYDMAIKTKKEVLNKLSYFQKVSSDLSRE